MRQITFTPSSGSAVVLGPMPYLITSVTGLGVPDTNNQEQKAPYQDGATYIDTLLEPRELVIEGAIAKPSDITDQNAAKAALAAAFNPKLGEGTLEYESDGIDLEITGVARITFANKEGTDPYQYFQIQVRCHNPYWQDTSDTTVSLNAFAKGTENFITPAFTGGMTVKNNNVNTQYFTAYVDGTTLKYVVRQSGVWSSPATVATGVSSLQDIISDTSNVYLWYVKSSNLYRIRFSLEETIFYDETLLGSISGQASAVNVDLVIMRKSSALTVKTTLAETTIKSTSLDTDLVSSVLLAPGKLFILGGNKNSYFIFTGSAYTEYTFTGTAFKTTGNLSCIKVNENVILILQSYTDTNYYVTSRLLDLNSGAMSEPVTIQYNDYTLCRFRETYDGEILCSFSVTSPSNKTGYTVFAVNTITNNGQSSTPIYAYFNGSVSTSGVLIVNDDEYILVDGVGFSTLGITTTFGNKTITINKGDGLLVNGFNYLKNGSTLFELKKGVNTILFLAKYSDTFNTKTISYKKRYVGI